MFTKITYILEEENPIWTYFQTWFLFAIYRAAQSLLSNISCETTGMEGTCVISKIN